MTGLLSLGLTVLATSLGCRDTTAGDRSDLGAGETISYRDSSTLYAPRTPPEDTTPNTIAPVTRPAPATSLVRLELVHEFQGPIPTGVAVSHDGRIFVSYPRWADPVEYTVVELVNNHEEPFPSREFNGGAENNPDALFSVQSVVIDPRNRLWCLDTGSEDMEPIRNLAMVKLVCIDLPTKRVVQTVHFPPGVIFETSYLNDVRFDLARGAAGYAFITDSSARGPNGIIVVDLASGHSWRRLNNHPTTRAERGVGLTADDKPLMIRGLGEPPRDVTVGSDGIAIAPHGPDQRLFYSPLAGRELHSVSVDALVDENMREADVARTIRSEHRNFASDGLECDAQGRLFLTDYEHDAINVRSNEGSYQVLVSDPKMLWPDSLAIGPDGYIYFTCNQLHRQKQFNNGLDLRRPPYHLFRVQAGATPVMIGRPVEERLPLQSSRAPR